MTFYSHNGAYPAPLPHLIWLSDGRPRTSQEPFTPEEIADAGYVEAPPEPAYDAATQRLGWDGENWTVEDLPPSEPEPVTPKAEIFAIAQLTIADGEVSGIGINSKLAGAFPFDLGKIFVAFLEPPGSEYMIQAAAGHCMAYVHPSEKWADGFLVTTTNNSGDPVDVEFVNISVLRV